MSTDSQIITTQAHSSTAFFHCWVPITVEKHLQDETPAVRVAVIETCRRIHASRARCANVSTRVLTAAIGGKARGRVMSIVKSSGAFRMVDGYIPGQKSKSYEFVGRPAPRRNGKHSGEKTNGYVWMPIDADLMDTHRQRVTQAMEDLGYHAALHTAVESAESAYIAETANNDVERVAAKKLPAVLAKRAARITEHQTVSPDVPTADGLAAQYLATINKINEGESHWKLANGRIYNAFQQLPRELRSHVMFDYHGSKEHGIEVDVTSCWWYCLTAALPESAERTSLLRLIRAGNFYETLAETAGHVWTDRSQLKIDIQRDCLFGRRKFGKSQLFKSLKKLAPSLAAHILKIRRQHRGVTRLAYQLQAAEGAIMQRAQAALLEMGIPSVGLHDGMIVPEYEAATAVVEIEQAALQIYITSPCVQVKV